jgi:hypothetical protein
VYDWDVIKTLIGTRKTCPFGPVGPLEQLHSTFEYPTVGQVEISHPVTRVVCHDACVGNWLESH